MSHEDELCSRLHDVSKRWSQSIERYERPAEIPIKRLPPPSYLGDNAYNGFTGSERRRGDQVLQILRRRNLIRKPRECALCGATDRIGFHGEDYFDPFSVVSVCFPCHMSIHARFRSPERWLARIDRYDDRPLVRDFRALPLTEVDFASWLRRNTSGPHDVVKVIWPNQLVEEYLPRPKRLSLGTARFAAAFRDAATTETEWKMLNALRDNPGATSADLSRQMGWSGRNAWHMKFGQFCHRLEQFLGPAPTASNRDNADGGAAKFYIGLLAEFDDHTRGFTLKLGVAGTLVQSAK
jgi:hypothetical protein